MAVQTSNAKCSLLQQRLRAVGVSDPDLLSYLLDREIGVSHAIAVERLFERVTLRVTLSDADRLMVAETLARHAPQYLRPLGRFFG